MKIQSIKFWKILPIDLARWGIFSNYIKYWAVGEPLGYNKELLKNNVKFWIHMLI